uniref:THAP-type domain-containing protein n=1 Tax=Schizaphis graminum TaxID=13262 RepID=A0A2S2PM06_SCHGA
MHRRCCFFCQSLAFKVPGLILHNFPTDIELRKIWLTRCGYTEKEFLRHNKLCSLHLDENSYKNTKSKKLLKKNALPTKFKKISKFNFAVECEQSTSEMAMNVSVENILETPKRSKRLCYIGDIATPDLSTPKRAKQHFNLAKLKILKQRRKIKTLQQRVKRLQKKY